MSLIKSKIKATLLGSRPAIAGRFREPSDLSTIKGSALPYSNNNPTFPIVGLYSTKGGNKLSTEWRQVEIVPYEGNISRYINELAELDRISFGDYGEVWTERNFLVDLPQKGRLSKLAISNERLTGYLICSSYQNQKRCHYHRLAVHQDYRRFGIAVKLWQESCRECLKLGIEEITLEMPNIATAARNLYSKLGFRSLKGGELANYLIEKGKEEKIARFTDDAEGSGVYFIEVKELWKKFEQ